MRAAPIPAPPVFPPAQCAATGGVACGVVPAAGDGSGVPEGPATAICACHAARLRSMSARQPASSGRMLTSVTYCGRDGRKTRTKVSAQKQEAERAGRRAHACSTSAHQWPNNVRDERELLTREKERQAAKRQQRQAKQTTTERQAERASASAQGAQAAAATTRLHVGLGERVGGEHDGHR